MSVQSVVQQRGRRSLNEETELRVTPTVRIMAAAGVVGPILFTVAFVMQGLFRSGEYSAVAEAVSALEAGPNGWVQQINFVVFGVLMIAFAIALHLGMRPSRGGEIGPAIIVLTGVGLVLAGAAFPLREDAAGLTYDPGGHAINGMMTFLSAGIGLIVVSRRMTRDPRWRSLAAYALASGITVLALFVAMRVLVMPPDAPLHAWGGLAQRLVLAVWFPCTIVLACRLLRFTKAPSALG